MKNPYSLLNYDMDNMEPTPEFTKATSFINDTIVEMVNAIKKSSSNIIKEDPSLVGYVFYGNLHWGSIGENRSTGDSKIDEIINIAVKKLVDFSNGPDDCGGIGDTATDEAIAYHVDELMDSKPKQHDFLLNRA